MKCDDQILAPLSKSIYSNIYSSSGDQEIKKLIEHWSLKLGNKPLTLLFNKSWWYGHLMDWSLKKAHFKTRLFHFVDVFPTLSSRKELTKHLKEYFGMSKKGKFLNLTVKFGLLLASFFPSILRKNILQMAQLFIAGQNLEESWPKILRILKNGKTFTLDLLGEFTVSEKEALKYQKLYLELLDQLPSKMKTQKTLKNKNQEQKKEIKINDEKSTYLKSNFLNEKSTNKTSIDKTNPELYLYKNQPNISIKLTSLFSQINEVAWKNTVETLLSRLKPILKKAVQKKCFINIDVEKYHYKDLTLDVFKKMITSPLLKDYPFIGIVLQAYLKDAVKDAKKLVEWAKTRNTPFTVRLVKGAYWDFEVNHALDVGWPIPVYEKKSETDANFERLAAYFFKNKNVIRIAIASQNIRSLGAACYFAKKNSLTKNEFEIQMLYGMADELKRILVNEGYFVREYVPIGEMIPGMSYLVRRLLENTANESFLRLKYKTKDTKNPFLNQNPFLNLMNEKT